nr:DUF2634 domain-containing protein [uncultured Fusobacterium sp.]
MDFNIFLEEQKENTNNLPLFMEYAIDFETGEYITDEKTNDIKILTGNEALKVWCFKALKTERNRYGFHTDSYGTDLFEHPGTIYQKSVKDALMINQIQDTLLVNPYILECYDFKIFNDVEDIPLITFKIKTIYGDSEVRYEE